MAKQKEIKYWLPPQFDEDGVQSASGIDNQGREHPDPVPLAPPVGYRAPPALMDMIRSMIQSENERVNGVTEELESFEEAEDFDIEDDPLDPLTPYERVFDPPPAQVPPAAAANTAAGVVASSSDVSRGPSPGTPSGKGSVDTAAPSTAVSEGSSKE